jgi:hypothetical protein
MTNPFEEILQEIKAVNDRLTILEKKTSPGPTRIPFSQFCKENNISRPTGYAWDDRGLIKTEVIGGRRFVLSESILVNQKYQREPALS